VQARNIYGWGAYSEVKVISASGIPNQMAMPSTQAVSDDLVITWDYPVDANSQITNYIVYIKEKGSSTFH
jgi:hypothetical protein